MKIKEGTHKKLFQINSQNIRIETVVIFKIINSSITQTSLKKEKVMKTTILKRKIIQINIPNNNQLLVLFKQT